MSEEKIHQITELIRREVPVLPGPSRLHPQEERRLRPLGLSSWSDKLIGEVVRLLVEAYYEP